MKLIAVSLLALLGACSAGQPANEQAVIDNAMTTGSEIVSDADDRADHLDEAAEEALIAANGASPAERGALQNEAEADLAAAAAARAGGRRAGDAAEDRIEAKAGLLNGQ